MLTQKQLKFIKSLHQKKNRQLNQQFIIEGEKMVHELLQSDFEILHIYFTADYFFDSKAKSFESTCISEKDLQRISTLKTPNKALALVKIPVLLKNIDLSKDYSLVLENVQDPGNLGTIIRTADWFGIQHIYCSTDTVDCYNAKVVQATMGSIYRVKIIYTDIKHLLIEAKEKKVSVMGAVLDGQNMYKNSLPKNALIVMGNESKGISEETKAILSHSIKIPSYPENSNVESLNVSIATALICGELRRQK